MDVNVERSFMKCARWMLPLLGSSVAFSLAGIPVHSIPGCTN
jgi:hypothetical protein